MSFVSRFGRPRSARTRRSSTTPFRPAVLPPAVPVSSAPHPSPGPRIGFPSRFGSRRPAPAPPSDAASSPRADAPARFRQPTTSLPASPRRAIRPLKPFASRSRLPRSARTHRSGTAPSRPSALPPANPVSSAPRPSAAPALRIGFASRFGSRRPAPAPRSDAASSPRADAPARFRQPTTSLPASPLGAIRPLRPCASRSRLPRSARTLRSGTAASRPSVLPPAAPVSSAPCPSAAPARRIGFASRFGSRRPAPAPRSDAASFPRADAPARFRQPTTSLPASPLGAIRPLRPCASRSRLPRSARTLRSGTAASRPSVLPPAAPVSSAPCPSAAPARRIGFASRFGSRRPAPAPRSDAASSPRADAPVAFRAPPSVSPVSPGESLPARPAGSRFPSASGDTRPAPGDIRPASGGVRPAPGDTRPARRESPSLRARASVTTRCPFEERLP